MNKTELVNKVAEVSELSKKDAARAVDAVLDVITGALANGDKVQLIGFGTLEVRERAARKGYNPALLKQLKEQGLSEDEAKTQAQIEIPASKTVGFSVGKKLKEAVK